MHLGLGFLCLLLSCSQADARQAPNFSAFIGSDACRSELVSTIPSFGVALDKSQKAFIETRQIDGRPTVLIIQYASDADRCGKLRDIVVASGPKDVFAFDCVDNSDPGRVVIGVHQGPKGSREWTAKKAWYIDFAKLRLTPTLDSVTCLNFDYSGADDSSDVRSRASARAKDRNH
jgi:hypothetical protein